MAKSVHAFLGKEFVRAHKFVFIAAKIVHNLLKSPQICVAGEFFTAISDWLFSEF